MNGISTQGSIRPTPLNQEQTKKSGSIGMHLNDLDLSIDELAKTVSEHESLINSVLAQIQPENTENVGEEGSSTEIGRILINLAYKVRSINEHVCSMNRRIEL